MDEKLQKLKDWIAECDNIVFFGGAGVSTESGIPDFRGEKGIFYSHQRIWLSSGNHIEPFFF